MPAAGPDINQLQFENAYADIMKLLREQYDIQTHPYPFKGTFMSDRMKELRTETNNKFKAALREVFFQQACEDF